MKIMHRIVVFVFVACEQECDDEFSSISVDTPCTKELSDIAHKNSNFPVGVDCKRPANGGSLLSVCGRLFALVVMVTAGCSATYI
jgi:hypothetical protein